jgi:hypothetical protein
VKALEDWCATNGLYVTTAEEREAEAIDRLLELEGWPHSRSSQLKVAGEDEGRSPVEGSSPFAVAKVAKGTFVERMPSSLMKREPLPLLGRR